MDPDRHIEELIDELSHQLLLDPASTDPLAKYVAGIADVRKNVSCTQCMDGLAIKIYLKEQPPFTPPQHYRDVHLLYEVSGPFVLH